MDAETLERLLLDRALGALTPDVESLLAAHLEHDPAAASRGREYDAAAGAARQALGPAMSAQLPPFPAVRIRAIERTRRQLVLVRNVASLAAALVLGVGLGSALFRPELSDRGSAPGANTTGSRVTLVVANPDQVRSASSGFWSAERLYDRARTARHAPATRVVWDSPVSEPRIGG